MEDPIVYKLLHLGGLYRWHPALLEARVGWHLLDKGFKISINLQGSLQDLGWTLIFTSLEVIPELNHSRQNVHELRMD
jgi:hypothetical protein